MTETVVARNQTKRKQVTTGSHHAGSGRQGRKKSQNGHPGRVAILAQDLTASRSAFSFAHPPTPGLGDRLVPGKVREVDSAGYAKSTRAEACLLPSLGRGEAARQSLPR